MDALAKQLIVLELAIPSVYVAMLKLTSGGCGTLDNPFFLALAFVAWLAALGFTLSSIVPQKQQLDQDFLTSIQDYFSRNATRKWQCLMVACIATFVGVALAVVAMFAMMILVTKLMLRSYTKTSLSFPRSCVGMHIMGNHIDYPFPRRSMGTRL